MWTTQHNFCTWLRFGQQWVLCGILSFVPLTPLKPFLLPVICISIPPVNTVIGEDENNPSFIQVLCLLSIYLHVFPKSCDCSVTGNRDRWRMSHLHTHDEEMMAAGHRLAVTEASLTSTSKKPFLRIVSLSPVVENGKTDPQLSYTLSLIHCATTASQFYS